MDYFAQLLQNCSDYKPVETWRIQCPDTIHSLSENRKHIQILHSSASLLDGHWVCRFYDMKNIFIYDSLNNKRMHKHHEIFLKRLFSTYPFDTCPVQFPTVQHQPNSNDSGVYAITFAISLLYNIKPENIKYNHSLMRSHFLKIFEINTIEHFPQDSRYAVHKVLPLAVVKLRETDAARKRKERQCTRQKIVDQVKKSCDIYECKKL